MLEHEDEVEMTANTFQPEDDKGKEKYAMLTSHDDGYQELTLTSDAMDESILDDEEEWHAQSDGENDSIVSESDEEAGDDDDDDDEEAEMVIEQPFEEGPSGALLDISQAETMLETPHSTLEPVSLDNILPEGSRRRRPAKFE